MDRFKIAISLVAMAIAGCGAILGLASQQPPVYPVPSLIIAGVVVLNAMLAVLQSQMPSWRDSSRASAAIDRMPPKPPSEPQE